MQSSGSQNIRILELTEFKNIPFDERARKQNAKKRKELRSSYAKYSSNVAHVHHLNFPRVKSKDLIALNGELTTVLRLVISIRRAFLERYRRRREYERARTRCAAVRNASNNTFNANYAHCRRDCFIFGPPIRLTISDRV